MVRHSKLDALERTYPLSVNLGGHERAELTLGQH